MTFRQKFIRLLEDRNHAAVAKRASLSRMSIAGYLSGKYAPRAETAMRLARALSVDASWLIDDSRGWPPVWVNHRDAEELAHAPAA